MNTPLTDFDPGPVVDDSSLREILDELNEAVQFWDEQGRLRYANAVTTALFGLPAPLAQGAVPDALQARFMQPDNTQIAANDLPFARVLRDRAMVANETFRLLCADGRERWLRINAHPLFAACGNALRGAVTTETDITGIVERENRLRQLAHYDALTRLPNRALLGDRLHLALARSQRMREMVAVCLLDLDGFKPVNDRYGHTAGDQVLREVAQRLTENVRSDDTVARLGGDEFALLLGGVKSLNDCDLSLRRILDSLSQPYRIGEDSVTVSASIGVTLFPNDGSDQGILLRHADQAMYKAKEAGKNRYMMFDPGQELRVKATQTMLGKIEKSIAGNEFCLYYQPKIDCRRGRVVGAEALVRWRHPILGMLSPSEFLPLIEQDDLIVVLGDWILRIGLEQAAAWYLQGLDIRISINISARQLHRKDFVPKLKRIAAAYPPAIIRNLEIEIVETAALEDVNTVSDSIRECRAMGISVALDDFGTGFSSLVHLKRLQTDILKIDQTFIRGMLTNAEDMAIVSAVIGLAGAFKQQVVAEGVETIDHILTLLDHGCDVMQGYGFARPMPADKLPGWIANFRPDPLWDLASSPRPSRDYFELLLAESNHSNWIDKLLSSIRQPDNCASDMAPLDANACRFANWYYGEAAQRFVHVPAFGEIESVHRRIHEQAVRLLHARASGNLVEVQCCEDALASQNARLNELLSGLRAVIVAELRDMPDSSAKH